MFSLSETFQSLKLEDGQPDLAARKAQLDDLKDHLSHTEIRRLCDQLKSFKMHTDIYIRLPADLLTIIVDYVELEDVMMARCVSRKWRHLFSAPELCLHIAQKQLPAIWAKYLLALQSSKEDVAKSMFLEWFSVAAIDRIKKLRGFHEIVSTHCYGHNYTPLPDMSSDDWQYKNGRVGYRIHSYGFVVKNLSTGVVSRFFDENRERIRDWLLSEQYIILSKSARNTLCALPINSSISAAFHTVQLPSRVSRISGQGTQVGVVTSIGDVFVWRIGGVMKQVETSQIYNDPTGIAISNTSVFFHPVIEQQFFVACLRSKNECRLNSENIYLVSLMVLEYADWKLSAIYQSGSLTSDYHGNRPFTFSGGAIACLISKSQVKGCGIWQDGPRPMDSEETNQHDEGKFQASAEQIIFATFSIWNKNFEMLTFCPPPAGDGFTVDSSRDALFWNSQILLPVAHAEIHDTQTTETPLLLAIHSIKSVDKPKQRAWHGRGDAPITESIVARGDDDTVVLFGKGTMVVWRFT